MWEGICFVLLLQEHELFNSSTFRLLSVLLKGKDFERRTPKSQVHCNFTVSFAISITSKIFKTKTGNGYNTHVNIDW